jgi:precorrin-6A/cobalt-precorrin-6A reductase
MSMPITIFLLGGTSETAPLAEALAAQGFSVLISTATDIPLPVGDHPRIRRRSGMLDETRFRRLLRDEDIRGIVDATHPYAEAIGPLARLAAESLHLPYFRWLRPEAVAETAGLQVTADHADAAALAFSWGPPVLLTIGSKNLEPYIRESRRTGIPVIARVLDYPDSRTACQKLGLPPEAVVTGKGPFSVDKNRATLRRYGIGVMVTKDSGVAGGVPEKLKAAKLEDCRVVVIRRPEPPGTYFERIEDLIVSLQTKVQIQAGEIIDPVVGVK